MDTMISAGADKIWADDSGGPGPVLVLLHEGVADARMWDPIWPELTSQFRTIRYDVRGYGRSPAPTEPYTLLGDLRSVLAHFGIDSAHFAGCSMGGATAMDFAIAEPGRVRSLVLLCPGITGYRFPEDEEAAAAEGGEDDLLRQCLQIWGAAGPDPFVTELARSAVRAWAYDEFEQEGEPALGHLAAIRAPAVLMVGDKDDAALIECAELGAARIPGCELIRMPGVDHYPTVREPGLVLRTIIRHCAD